MKIRTYKELLSMGMHFALPEKMNARHTELWSAQNRIGELPVKVRDLWDRRQHHKDFNHAGVDKFQAEYQPFQWHKGKLIANNNVEVPLLHFRSWKGQLSKYTNINFLYGDPVDSFSIQQKEIYSK